MLRTEQQSTRMSKINNGGLDQYDAEHWNSTSYMTSVLPDVQPTASQHLKTFENQYISENNCCSYDGRSRNHS